MSNETEGIEPNSTLVPVPSPTEVPACTCQDEENVEDDLEATDNDNDIINLRFLGHASSMWIEPAARAFEASKLNRVKISLVPATDFAQLFGDIVNEAKSQVGLYDGFLSPPSISGSVVEYAGWADLKPFIQESAQNLADWSDILLGYRQNLAQYEDQIIMFPLDGDIHSLYYRKDILNHFGLEVPRTWDEYNAVAKATHGRVFQNMTLSGSCVGRVADCAGPYWSNLLLSSITQTHGAATGHIFDTRDMKPLAGPALEQVLAWLADQVKYGAANEFETCLGPNIAGMNSGQCVLTYNWGNTFTSYINEGSAITGDKLGVAATPGTTRVLDRESMTLVPCNEELCKHGDYYDDIGWVNRAPYLAFGGWSCAVNNYTSPVHKRLATEFCAFAASAQNFAEDGQDPFRQSHLDEEIYIARGYERGTTVEYLDAIRKGIGSQNAVNDIRFPSATLVYSALDKQTHNFLNRTKFGFIAENAMEMEIRDIVTNLTQEWQTIIVEHDATAKVPALEIYQRLRGVYTENIDMKTIGDIRMYGDVLASGVVVSALGFIIWTWYARTSFVIRASQPTFLFMICLGALILGSSIIPLGLDDGAVGEEAAGRACMSVPWLLVVGWSLLSSALGAKLHRVNTVFQNAVRFRKVEVTMTEFVIPLVLLTLLNVTFLLVWTVVDPGEWQRTQISDTESVGKCQYNTGNITSKICYCVLAVANGLTLLYTNYQAYKARHIASEYGESKQIAMAMGSILQIVIISVPLLYIVEDNPTATYFLQASIVFVASQSILWLMFFPKVRAWRSGTTATATVVVSGNTVLPPAGGTRSPVVSNGTTANIGVTFAESVEAEQKKRREQELDNIRRKLVELERILKNSGIETESLFQEAGLSEYSDKERVMNPSNASSTSSFQQGTSLEPRREKGLTSWADMNHSVSEAPTGSRDQSSSCQQAESENLDDVESAKLNKGGYRVRPALEEEEKRSEEDDFATKVRGYAKGSHRA